MNFKNIVWFIKALSSCMLITKVNKNKLGAWEALTKRREHPLKVRSTGKCKLLKVKRVGGRGYTWSKVKTCRTQRREKLITQMACYFLQPNDMTSCTYYRTAATVYNQSVMFYSKNSPSNMQLNFVTHCLLDKFVFSLL